MFTDRVNSADHHQTAQIVSCAGCKFMISLSHYGIFVRVWETSPDLLVQRLHCIYYLSMNMTCLNIFLKINVVWDLKMLILTSFKWNLSMSPNTYLVALFSVILTF